MDNRRCYLCGKEHIKLLHKGTRDNPSIDVLKCNECGLVFLSSFEHIHNGFYENSQMSPDIRKKDEWKKSTSVDNLRRVNTLSALIKNKDVLDFGCGKGGFINCAEEKTRSICGIELDKATRDELNNEGYCIWESLDQCNRRFDVITMFHVIEHLEFPLEILESCKKHLNDEGKLIIETPNANDALLAKYHSDAFADFTYWSPHIFLYNEENLLTLANKAGFKIAWSKQIQRYPLANHLYWLAKGKPSGQAVYDFLNCEELNDHYERILSENKLCDTLLICLSL